MWFCMLCETPFLVFLPFLPFLCLTAPPERFVCDGRCFVSTGCTEFTSEKFEEGLWSTLESSAAPSLARIKVIRSRSTFVFLFFWLAC